MVVLGLDLDALNAVRAGEVLLAGLQGHHVVVDIHCLDLRLLG